MVAERQHTRINEEEQTVYVNIGEPAAIRTDTASEAEKIKKENEKKRRIEEKKAKAAYERACARIMLGFFAAAILVFLMSTVFLFRNASITEITGEVNKINSAASKKESENEMLRAYIESEEEAVNIDEVAQNQLGMQKPQSYQKKEITIPPVDKTVVIQSDTASEDSRPWTQRLAEKVRYFFGFVVTEEPSAAK